MYTRGYLAVKMLPESNKIDGGTATERIGLHSEEQQERHRP